MKRQILQRNPKWTYKAGNKDPIIVQAIITASNIYTGTNFNDGYKIQFFFKGLLYGT